MERFTLDKLPQEVRKNMDLETVFMASRILVAAERLEVFRKLSGKRLSSTTIGETLKLHPRYLEMFLNALVSIGLLRKKKDLYWNSSLAEKYFIQERPIFWTRQFSAECLETFEAFTVIEKALKSGKSSLTIRRKKKMDYLDSMRKNPEEARNFTQMLFYYHLPYTEALAEYLDLSHYKAVLDVGGGSGVMSIALVRKNPGLKACIMDIEPVCRIAKENIKKAGLSKRMDVIARDFKEDLPQGYDVIMCCDIGPVFRNLLKRIFRRLPQEGMIVLVDRFMSEDKTKPLDRILYNLAGSRFDMHSQGEMAEALRNCGFKKVKKYNICKDVWVITGLKKNI